MSGIQIDTFNVTGEGEAGATAVLRVTAPFFNVFGVRPYAGRTFTQSEDRPGASPVLVLSQAFAHRRSGGTAALGRRSTWTGGPTP